MRDVTSEYLTRNTQTSSRFIPAWPGERVSSQPVRTNYPDSSEWPLPHQDRVHLATCRAAYMNGADLCTVGIISTDVAESNC